jgi:type VI secretion system protein ImpA
MAWIKQDILPPPSVEAVSSSQETAVIETPVPEPPSNVDTEVPSMEQDLTAVDEVFEAALSRARSGYLHEAIEIISNELATERTGRGRFKRRVQLTHLMVGAGKSKIAYPILKQLAAEIDSRHLDDWEAGQVLSYPLGLLLECARHEDDSVFCQQIYARICQIDPLYGLKFGD